ncbi:MAG TPA: thiamine phosphate synthase [Bryobacteraceae bacterium]|jgi:thiamine-phosphate pyrophosphorylase|nr:thiamine phosphate synthase [Bryobacteraceae bacterium]
MKRYYITDRKAVGGFGALLEIIRDQIHLAVDFIQIREKDVSARELFEFASAVVAVRAGQAGKTTATKILVNTRADVSLAAGCDGVHLPSRAPQETLPGLIVARSCHTISEIVQSKAAFVTFGPVFASPGKGEPIGLETLRRACRHGKPVFALGGINWGNAAACMDAGAEGIAGIRLFQQPEL